MTAAVAHPLSGAFRDWIVAVSLSVFLHLVMLLLMILWVFHNLSSSEISEKEKEEPEKITLELRPDYFRRLPKKAERKPFADTTDSQTSSLPPTYSKYIGERTTEATSDALLVAGAPERPSLLGETPENKNQTTSFDEQFGMNGNAIENLENQTNSSPSTESVVSEEPLSKIQPTLPSKSPIDALPQTPQKTLDDDQKNGNKSLQKILNPSNEIEQSIAKSETQSLPPPAQDLQKSPLPASRNQRPDGHEARKTKIQGSISRRGKSSLAVSDTPLGRYEAALGKAVEREWQTNNQKYRDHISPGSVTAHFLVDRNGKVSKIRLVEAKQGIGIKKGFLLRAIQTAKIPPMPKELIKELKGNPLPQIYNFSY